MATKPIKDHEHDLEKIYTDDFFEYEKDYMAWKQARDEGIKKCKTKSSKKHFLDEMGEEPEAPPQPVLLIEEPTYEGLIKVLQCGLPSVGLFTDEGGRFVGGHAMNSENALKTVSGISSLWDKGEAKRTRAGDGHSGIYGKRLSMHLMMQGVVADMLMGNDIFRQQGWLSRVLMSWPESTVGERPYVSENIFEDPAIKEYHSICTDLLQLELPMNDKRELNPPILELSRQASRLWIPFHDYCDSQAKQGGELEAVRGLANKAPEHAARLAGILSVMKGASIIGLEELESGIELMNYYLNEGIRIADAGQINNELKNASILLKWLQGNNHMFVYPVMIYQKAPITKLREKTSALAAIKILENHGWLEKVSPMVIDGSRRKDAWRLIRVQY